jgi:hypothetical protein
MADPLIKKAVNFVKPFLNKLAGKPSSSTAVKPGSSKPTSAPSMVKTKPGSSKPKKQATKPLTTKPTKTTANDPKAKLNKAIAAIKPVYANYIKTTPKVSDLKAQLEIWRKKYDVTAVQLTKSSGKFNVLVKVNPEGNAGSGFIPLDADLRLSARKSVDALMKDKKVLARAKQIQTQAKNLAAKGENLGGAENPFQMKTGLDTLALLVFSRQTPVTADKPISGTPKPVKGQTEQKFEYDGQKVSQSKTQAGTNAFVRGLGTYDEITGMVGKIKESSRRTDSEIAIDMRNFVRNGKLPEAYTSSEKTQLTRLRHLITFNESLRSPDNVAHIFMMLDQIASGSMTWAQGLKELPMRIKKAAGLKRGLEAVDQGIESVSPKMAAFVRKYMPSIKALRDQEAKVIKDWLTTVGKDRQHAFSDANGVEKFVTKEMKKFYGI